MRGLPSPAINRLHGQDLNSHFYLSPSPRLCLDLNVNLPMVPLSYFCPSILCLGPITREYLAPVNRLMDVMQKAVS